MHPCCLRTCDSMRYRSELFPSTPLISSSSGNMQQTWTFSSLACVTFYFIPFTSSILPGGHLWPTVHTAHHRSHISRGAHGCMCLRANPFPCARVSTPISKLSITPAWEICASVQQHPENNINPLCICRCLFCPPSLLHSLHLCLQRTNWPFHVHHPFGSGIPLSQEAASFFG